MSFTNDYIRFTMVYTVHIKDKQLGTLQRYYNQIYTKFNLKITRIYTNCQQGEVGPATGASIGHVILAQLVHRVVLQDDSTLQSLYYHTPAFPCDTNYRIELYSKKVTAQIDNLGIEFEPTTLYAQEENRVIERLQRTSTKITRLIILTGNILDFLQPNILLIAIYIKNRRPIRALSGILLYKRLKGEPSLVYYLRALGSTIYSLIVKEDRVKLARFAL